MPSKNFLKYRKSIRSYTGKLKEEDLVQIINLAQTSPVGMGKFDTIQLTVIQNKELLNEIDKNGAQIVGNPDRHMLYGAPCFVIISAKLDNVPDLNVPYSNAAIMAENLCLAATSLNVGSCLIWGAIRALNKNSSLVSKLNLPNGFTPCCGVILGESSDALIEREIDLNKFVINYIK